MEGNVLKYAGLAVATVGTIFFLYNPNNFQASPDIEPVKQEQTELNPIDVELPLSREKCYEVIDNFVAKLESAQDLDSNAGYLRDTCLTKLVSLRECVDVSDRRCLTARLFAIERQAGSLLNPETRNAELQLSLESVIQSFNEEPNLSDEEKQTFQTDLMAAYNKAKETGEYLSFEAVLEQKQKVLDSIRVFPE